MMHRSLVGAAVLLAWCPALDAQPTRGSNPSLAAPIATWDEAIPRSEEHTSELQSH